MNGDPIAFDGHLIQHISFVSTVPADLELIQQLPSDFQLKIATTLWAFPFSHDLLCARASARWEQGVVAPGVLVRTAV